MLDNQLQKDEQTEESKSATDPLLSVVIPVYDEEDVLEEFHRRLSHVLSSVPMQAEIIYVNDGSRDSSLATMLRLHESDDATTVIDLSRNFGKEIAMTAGLDLARGDAVVIIDADLQDPPELIPELVNRWIDGGFDNVYAQRTQRLGETWLKKATASAFYRVMTHFGEVALPPDAGDFRLLSRRAVDALKRLPERHRFMKGLYAWVGFPSIAVPYQRAERFGGVTKWNYWKLWNLALEGFTSYSTMPLRIAGLVGTVLSMGAFAFGAFIIAKKVLYGDPVPGYPSLMVVVSFFGGIQLLSLGIIGEYLARIFDETKFRPLYLLKGYFPSRHVANKNDDDECLKTLGNQESFAVRRPRGER